MYQATRRTVTLSLLALVAGCGAKKSKFKSYTGAPVTQVVVNKRDRRLYMLNGTTVLKSYSIGLGNQPIGHKQFEGDGKTPEGIYTINRFNPRSAYYLSVGVSYPNPNDLAFATQQGQRPGGDIFIHGQGPDGKRMADQRTDWTAGCIAVKDAEIEEIFAMLRPGVPIVINP